MGNALVHKHGVLRARSLSSRLRCCIPFGAISGIPSHPCYPYGYLLSGVPEVGRSVTFCRIDLPPTNLKNGDSPAGSLGNAACHAHSTESWTLEQPFLTTRSRGAIRALWKLPACLSIHNETNYMMDRLFERNNRGVFLVSPQFGQMWKVKSSPIQHFSSSMCS